jgi:galactokinase/mevalonate kinase-like predicted kinase
MFDFARDYLGLLKAAVIAAGIVPPGLEGSDAEMSDLLTRLVGPGRGIELVSKINDIPKGSRLAVSTNLLGSLISVLMRATGQVQSLQGALTEADRRIVAARAILGEWIGGSGGGWQDSGGVWPGIKLICGTQATEDDPEFGISRGRLMPVHQVLSDDELSQASTREKIQDSLVLVHGGMAQNVGPILEMVTEHYLLRSENEWDARQEAIEIYNDVVAAIRKGDIRRIGELTTRNFEGPLRAIIPWSTNRFTDQLIQICRDQYGDQFWGFWMLGGMAGGGMGFIFDPKVKEEAADWLSQKMIEVKHKLSIRNKTEST